MMRIKQMNKSIEHEEFTTYNIKYQTGLTEGMLSDSTPKEMLLARSPISLCWYLTQVESKQIKPNYDRPVLPAVQEKLDAFYSAWSRQQGVTI